jgi:hypothetical protein
VTSPVRLFTDQLIAWLQAEVEDADGWSFIREEPRDYVPGENCAIWWTGDEPFDSDSTTGWLGLVDVYQLRYWEPADEGSRTTEDEDAGDVLSTKLQQVRRTIALHRALPAGSLADASEMVYLGSTKLGAEDGASGVRGFSVGIRVRRSESYY